MALSFTTSYTFSPNTTISSSQVNTNFSDIAAVFQGLEAETKTLAKLKMDIDPTIALEVATKQYVDHYSTWRRPNLVYGSATTVSVESALDGTSGNIPMLFPDGTIRTETSTTRTTFNITRNAVLTTSGAQSGLRTSLSEANDTWYALYAVKVTDSSTQWCTVGDTVLPVQPNYSTLNTNFGTNGWVYLGLIRNGEHNAASGDIVKFVQAGNRTSFVNLPGGGGIQGLLLASATGSASNLSYTYSSGTGTTNIPGIISLVTWIVERGTTTNVTTTVLDVPTQVGSHTLTTLMSVQSKRTMAHIPDANPQDGVLIAVSSTDTMNIWLKNWVDGVLGVGSHPQL